MLADIEHAERLGVAIAYGYLFDHIHQSAEAMARQIQFVAREPRLPMPVYLSVVAPLAGTQSFWEELEAGNLAANLRLRDLDGEVAGETTTGGQRITLPKGHGLPPGTAATGHLDAMAMYAGESAAVISAVEPAAQIIESWAAAVQH